MATLHVRNMPDELYERIRELARSRDRSISAEVVNLLDAATERQEGFSRRRRLLAKIRRHRFSPRRGTPDSVELLREDRKR